MNMYQIDDMIEPMRQNHLSYNEYQKRNHKTKVITLK